MVGGIVPGFPQARYKLLFWFYKSQWSDHEGFSKSNKIKRAKNVPCSRRNWTAPLKMATYSQVGKTKTKRRALSNKCTCHIFGGCYIGMIRKTIKREKLPRTFIFCLFEHLTDWPGGERETCLDARAYLCDIPARQDKLPRTLIFFVCSGF